MKVAVIGTGYVGLVTGACLAHLGHQVIGVDQSAEKIAVLASGALPIWEQGLYELLDKANRMKRIRFTTRLAEAIEQSEALIVCVGTPSGPSGEADLTALWSVIEQIDRCSASKQTVIIKSTVPVGTTDEVWRRLSARPSDRSLEVIHNPEFLRQGSAVSDFLKPDRIVAGCYSDQATAIIAELYKGIDAPIVYSDTHSSELIKYAANAFLAMKISFMNMVADFAELSDARIDVVAEGIGLDRRIGSSFLRAGVGYGGSCFPKDIQSFIAMGKHADCPLPLLEATQSINARRPQQLVDKLVQALGTLANKRIALLGLSFKAHTDDIREAPSLVISRLCIASGAEVHAYDAYVRDYPVAGVVQHDSVMAAVEGADALIVLTEAEQQLNLDWPSVAPIMRNRLVIDGRNGLDWEQMRQAASELGITYVSIGRPPIYANARMEAMR